MKSPTKKQFPFHIGMSLYLLAVVLLLTVMIFFIVHRQSVLTAQKDAINLFQSTTADITHQLKGVLRPAMVLSRVHASAPSINAPLVGDGMNHPFMAQLIESLQVDKNLYAVYVGLANGDFIQAIAAVENPGVRALYEAPEQTAVIARIIHGTPRKTYLQFLDHQGKVLEHRQTDNPSYNPVSRPWYGKALTSKTFSVTDAYVFNSSPELGITVSHALKGGAGVVGVDLTLRQLNRLLQEKQISKHSHLLIFDQQKRVLAYQGFNGQTPIQSLTPMDALGIPQVTLLENLNPAREQVEVHPFKGDPYLLVQHAYTPIPEHTLNVAVISPLSDFTGHVRNMRQTILVSVLLLMLVLVPLIIWSIRKLSKVLVLLAEDAERIQRLDFDGKSPEGSMITEVNQLTSGFAALKETILARTEAMQRSQAKLQKVLDISISLGVENDHEVLLEKILLGGIELTRADAGTLYMLEDDKLHFKILRTNSLGMSMGGKSGQPVTLPPMNLHHPETGEPNHSNVATYTALTAKTVNIVDAYDNTTFDFSGTRKFDAATGYRSQSFLNVPLVPRGGKVLGVLQLLNAQDPVTGATVPFEADTVSIIEALSAQAAVTLENKTLLEAQKALFDSFIRLMAGAIDAKSAYTGGHCERVPILGQRLADLANRATDGPFAGFTMNETQAEEMRVAAWLHDCGKVTTPEYVVDKATKLETTYNRIHEVRMRFEVLYRDAQIQFWQDVAQGNGMLDALEKSLKEKKAQLDNDFEFLATSNVGGEYMAPEKQERIRQIAQIPWMRYFDDRLGLSEAELLRVKDLEKVAIPARESLLSDRADHILPRLDRDKEVAELEALGITMPVPENQYNFGEIYNLCIAKGTLSNEERFKINEHVVQSILMLEKLPFPEGMKNVPEFAGAHHETMIGTGYPRGLKKDQMSVQARIMAIADVFEALTAADRPYKKPKKMSEAIKIMSFMVKDQHIDKELFQLFLSSGLYHEYGEEYLLDFQMDDVDIRPYLDA
ncbi:metal dependent phosphohydrolase [Magnetococcus marinus MC-1]|uniref:Metal dependent phosphohydrolase n=1 Tax=Magnetococcus marinus (strain ATCC BAA-1437 / JCM 17883 / MC-1) TaxID=156889 RepID=A0L7V4_MAGMM|nr:HD domain-containing phosphohydrolase [Magnetococcus marinus]ABK44047.1 metal dependent phosphohydrolase [Magnetococcus marinus MC-1]